MDDTDPFREVQWHRFRGRVHPESKCEGEACCVHHPSDHPLATAPLNWRADRWLMERICKHGVGHPDPDDIAFKQRIMTPADYKRYAFESHGCDGCCVGGWT